MIRIAQIMALAVIIFSSNPLKAAQSILFLGDSITGSLTPSYVGYYHHVVAARPSWDIDLVIGTTTQNILDQMANTPDLFSGYDCVYFNTGLHSIRSDRFEDASTYSNNLSLITANLQTFNPSGSLIWRSTTQVSVGASGGRDHTLVSTYNTIAEAVMDSYSVTIDDMFDYLNPSYTSDPSKGGAYMVSDGTHWNTDSQINIITPRVIETLENSKGLPAPEPSTPLLLMSALALKGLFSRNR